MTKPFDAEYIVYLSILAFAQLLFSLVFGFISLLESIGYRRGLSKQIYRHEAFRKWGNCFSFLSRPLVGGGYGRGHLMFRVVDDRFEYRAVTEADLSDGLLAKEPTIHPPGKRRTAMASLKSLVRNTARKFGYSIAPIGSVRDDGYLDKSEFQYILWLDRVYQKIAQVPGNIIEIGVARGRNSILFGRMIELHGEQATRKYYGFDTFNGYAQKDLKENRGLDPNAWKSLGMQEVNARIQDAGLSKTSYLIKGDIRKTAQTFIEKGGINFQPHHLKIALLYIDCNAYDPALFSMTFFKKYMSPGGIICIDEKKQGGESKALEQFCRDNGLKMVRDPGAFGIPAYTVIE